MTTTTRIIIDTDILIDVGRGVQEAIAYVQAKEQVQRVAISTITYLELLVGAQHKQEQQKIKRFLQRFEHVRINENISDIAIDLMW